LLSCCSACRLFWQDARQDGGVILVYQLAEKSETLQPSVVEAIYHRLSHLDSRRQVEVKEMDDGKFEVTLIGVSDEELKSARKCCGQTANWSSAS
jgi:hypothetical protein